VSVSVSVSGSLSLSLSLALSSGARVGGKEGPRSKEGSFTCFFYPEHLEVLLIRMGFGGPLIAASGELYCIFSK
jgi:hypothetical protein